MKKISIANGNYIGKDGQQKTSWVKVGVMFVSENGKEYILLDPTVNLAAFKREDGKDMVICSVYDDSQQGQGYQQQQPQQPQQQYQAPTPTYVDANGNPIPPQQNMRK